MNILNTSVMLLTVMYYDKDGRLIESRGQNQLGAGYERVMNTYNFPGQLTTTTREHTAAAATTTILNKYSYDHAGRKITTKSKINANAEIVLSKLEYNELGMVKRKNLHSTDSVNFYQNTKFAYNERGWLKGSNSAQFNMRLGYDTLSNPQYNGNIAVQRWGTGYANQFLYTYDALNRLTNGTSTGIAMSEALSYDKMGNIATMNRDAGGSAAYSYTGNRLTGISGGGLTTGSYAYDVNGNATTDGRNAMTLRYNMLNLIDSAYKSGTNIGYRYSATGQKLRKISSGTVTQYVNGIQYTAGKIDFIQTEEGRAIKSGSYYFYNYDLTDHLGNVRYTFDINAGALRKLQEDDYYAFGLQKVATGGTNKYLYNGKELQSETGMYDYGARFYDPVIGRWLSVDPLAEKYSLLSVYNYVLNNPIRLVDKDGMEATEGGDPVDYYRAYSTTRMIGFGLRHPGIAASIGSVEHHSTNISTNAARFAINTGLAENKAHEGSQVNAYRHTLWQSSISSEFGNNIAAEVGNAHEDNPSVDLSTRLFTGADALHNADQTIDLLNNQIGRRIGEENKGASMKELAMATLNEFKNGGLFTATINKNGSVTVSKTKLTNKQYNQAIKNIQNTNSNGFTPEQEKEKKAADKKRAEENLKLAKSGYVD